MRVREQLDLFSWQPPPELMTIEPVVEPEPELPPEPPPPKLSASGLAWWQGNAAYYLRIMLKIQASSSLPLQAKQAEIQRLHELRTIALNKLEEGNEKLSIPVRD